MKTPVALFALLALWLRVKIGQRGAKLHFSATIPRL